MNIIHIQGTLKTLHMTHQRTDDRPIIMHLTGIIECLCYNQHSLSDQVVK